MMVDKIGVNLPRGIRNNNPLNIRKNNRNHWVGKIEKSSDEEFEQFFEIGYGLRAAILLLFNYRINYNLCSIEEIIGKWAPASENNTEKYIKYVCAKLGILRDSVVPFASWGYMIMLIHSMAFMECGVSISWVEIWKAYKQVKHERGENDDVNEGLWFQYSTELDEGTAYQFKNGLKYDI